MSLIDPWWARTFKSQFVPQLAALVDVLEHRTLSAFESIDEETQRAADESWERLVAGYSDQEDLGEFWEAAQVAAGEHCLLLKGIRQGIVNLFAVALYHAFEQQAKLFQRKALFVLNDRSGASSNFLTTFRARLLEAGIDIGTFPSWGKMDELRLIANTVKHAEGNSARELRQRRAELFDPPDLRNSERSLPSTDVLQPLAGEDLFVSLDDIRHYRDALVRFWEDLGEAILSNREDG